MSTRRAVAIAHAVARAVEAGAEETPSTTTAGGISLTRRVDGPAGADHAGPAICARTRCVARPAPRPAGAVVAARFPAAVSINLAVGTPVHAHAKTTALPGAAVRVGSARAPDPAGVREPAHHDPRQVDGEQRRRRWHRIGGLAPRGGRRATSVGLAVPPCNADALVCARLWCSSLRLRQGGQARRWRGRLHPEQPREEKPDKPQSEDDDDAARAHSA